MTFELPTPMENKLRDLAARQGRDPRILVEDAVRDYVEAAAITDLEASEIAETQATLAGELRGIPGWQDGGQSSALPQQPRQLDR